MSRGRHRRSRPVRDFIAGLGILWALRRYSEKRMKRATPAEIQRAGLTMADAVAAATTNYEVVEPCPWGLSYGACTIFHPADHVGKNGTYAAV